MSLFTQYIIIIFLCYCYAANGKRGVVGSVDKNSEDPGNNGSSSEQPCDFFLIKVFVDSDLDFLLTQLVCPPSRLVGDSSSDSGSCSYSSSMYSCCQKKKV